MLPCCLAQLPDERHLPLAVYCNDRHGSRVLDDLAGVLAPPLHGHSQERPLVHALRGVGLESHARAASTSATVTSTIPSRSATETCSSGVWKPYTPCERFTQRRPRTLKTFASAPPPDSPYRGSKPQRANAAAASATAGSSRFSR